MRNYETADKVLEAVRLASLLGITSPEIASAHGITINHVTAALHALTGEQCVRREKDPSSGHLYRYWYVRPRSTAPRVPRADSAHGAPSGTVLTIQTGSGPLSLTLSQGRKLYGELGKIFGGIG